MYHRIPTPALLVPVLLLAGARPASAQFDFGSWFQRAMIIANQITQISHQVTQVRSMARQLSELRGQLDHMERAAKGEIDALFQPFSRLAADPVGLVRDGLGWRSDFTGPARGTADAVRDMGSGRSFTELWRTAHAAADQVGEADILELLRDQPPEAAARALEDHRRAREAADRQRVLDYAALDAAAALAGTIESAQGSFAGLTANGNLSRQHVSRCSHWLTGSRGSEMPPELPQTCNCPRHPSATPSSPFRCWAHARARPRGSRRRTGSRVHSTHYGTNARMIPGFTIETRRTER